MERLHATCVCVDGAGVLLRGPSGSGKSDLALRLVDGGALLIADDQVLLEPRQGRLWASAPAPLHGLLEARGLGVLDVPHAAEAPVLLVADLGPADRVARFPDADRVTIGGVRLRRIDLAPFEASAPAKLRLAMAVARADLPVATAPALDPPGSDPPARETPASGYPAVTDRSSPRPPESPNPALQALGSQAPAARPQPATTADPGSPPCRPIVIISGLSGAGLSTALKALEDLGYEAVDNLRLSLLTALIVQALDRPLAIGIDTRTRDFDPHLLLTQLQALRQRPELCGTNVHLVFMEAGDEVLQRRYTETRRPHPLALDRPVPDGIALERALLEPLREAADLTVDTSQLSIHDVRRLLAGHFRLDATPDLHVFVTSFAYRHGVPREADLVFDVRFLDNPHWDPALRPLTGLDAPVGAHIERDPDFAGFFARLTDLLAPLLPRYAREGKRYLTIAVGCTGGRHRSVFIAGRLARWLRGQGVEVGLSHRDMARKEHSLDAVRDETPIRETA